VLSPTKETVRFGLFELDQGAAQLTRNGTKIRLPQQPLLLLAVLLESPGEIVTREQLRQRLWPSDIFIDFDHGLNKSIQKLREALRDSADSPRYIETIPRVGYRFIAPVNFLQPMNEARGVLELNSDKKTEEQQHVPAPSPGTRIARDRRARWLLLALGGVACVAVAFGGAALFRSLHRPLEVSYTQLTDFTDSAAAPALSPDGRMVAFIRGGGSFLTSDRIYVKMLPNGETRRVTNDDRPKYGLAFSPDGSEIAYTVLEPSGFSTYEVSALGGEPHLLLSNAAGLVWLDPQRLLFSEIRSGIHMGMVMSTATRADLREIYFPEHERGMAHYSFPSPDRRWALVVEMNGSGGWAPCRLVGLEGKASSKPVGPTGACTSAGWSPDGSWMYFTATVEGQSHIWRQRFPAGGPEQITFGPTEENGLAVDPGGHALITSEGVHESSIWIHDGSGDRSLSSEGEVAGQSPPVFSRDATVLYYLLRLEEGAGAELWRTEVNSGQSEAVFPGVSMIAFDVSADGKWVVYESAAPGGKTQLWLAPMGLSVPAIQVGVSGARSPRFGARGQILFQLTEGNANYLEQMNRDGSHRSKVLPYPIVDFQGLSPGGRWAMAAVPMTPQRNFPTIVAIPLDGGAPRRICTAYCLPRWSMDGKFLFVTVKEPSSASVGRSLAIPVGPGESLPPLPVGGIAPLAESSGVRGAESVGRGELVPGSGPGQYAWVNTTVHRNLYRISLP
jgi:DNA-binding winged helix-turn-helix (wHTH) protein